MSKKTRSEKIIAQLRREVKLSQQKIEPIKTKRDKDEDLNKTSIDNISRKIFENQIKDFEVRKPENRPDSTLISPEISVFIKKDLSKTFLLSGLVICLILLLYWSFELNGQNILLILPKKLF